MKLKKPDKRRFIVEQDIEYAKSLAANNPKYRERALRHLRKWLIQRFENDFLAEENLMIIWRGVFFNMWMSDKSLIQEDCAEKIAQLLHLPTPELSILCYKCSLQTFINEWHGIDQLRLDKFQMLVRRILRQSFEILNKNDWNMELIKNYQDVLAQTILNNATRIIGLVMHFTEIYLEELAKVSNGAIETEVTAALIYPFIEQLARVDDNRLATHTGRHIFRYLMKQSDLALQYQEKFNAWKQMGFPGGSIDLMQKVQEVDEPVEEVEQERILDPRAGKVDVILPQLQFDAAQIAKMLEEHKFKKGSVMTSRPVITKLICEFQEMAKGDYPLGIKRVATLQPDNHSTKLKSSVKRLQNFEQDLYVDSAKNRKRKPEPEPETVKVKKPRVSAVSKHKEVLEFIKMKEHALIQSALLDDSLNLDEYFTRNSGNWFVFTDDSKSKEEAVVEEAPLEDGEVEIFIPSKKYNKKHKIRNKGTHNSSIPPMIAKKVKIDLKLNRSQDIREHQALLKQSPDIPYDAKRKPLKPLLKSNLIGSPINPFYIL